VCVCVCLCVRVCVCQCIRVVIYTGLMQRGMTACEIVKERTVVHHANANAMWGP